LPLFADGLKRIRRNLVQIQSGERPRLEKIGFFTPDQLTHINESRIANGFQPLLAEVVFHGAHLYRSRCIKNGYSINQVLDQIESAFSTTSVVNFSPPSSVMHNLNKRKDHNGKLVNDEAVFECTARYPYAELYSVIPKGDGRPKP
jgi:hypothetical protein